MGDRRIRSYIALLTALAACGPVAAGTPDSSGGGVATIEGRAFLDLDGDGQLSAGEVPLPGARVAWNTSAFTLADADGWYALTVPEAAAGIVWVSVPSSGRPGPAWTSVAAASGTMLVDVPIAPAPPLAPGDSDGRGTFIVASDTHMDGQSGLWTPADMALALEQALVTTRPPRFFTVVGDITQANRPEDFDAVAAALDGMTVPWVPVPGNHDWYDGGAAYRATWGPDAYSFDVGTMHVIVWNTAQSDALAAAFVRADLAGRPADELVIALGHVPPSRALAEDMRDAGVDVLFTGHWHANRVVRHGALVEYNTQPMVMGGIDLSPAGYRVVEFDNGVLGVAHHTFVDAPVVELVWPPADGCAASPFTLTVAAEAGAGLAPPTALVAGAPVTLSPAGGWLWTSAPLDVPVGVHAVEIAATSDDGAVLDLARDITVCAGQPPPIERAPWPQPMGGTERHASTSESPTLPYAHAWLAPAGAHLHQSHPIIDGGIVYVTTADLGAGDRGGVIALDLATGALVWRHVTDLPVRGSPALEGDTVVIGLSDGRIQALDAATGATRWGVALGDGVEPSQSSLWGTPAIRDGVVYTGTQRRFVALALDTGAELWRVDPFPDGMWLGSFSAPAVTDDLVVATFNRTSGLVAFDRETGAEVWRVATAATRAVNTAPVVIGDRVVVGNVSGEVVALDLASGDEVWRTRVVDGGHDWAYAIAGSMAFAGGLIVVPTQWGALVALDADSGEVLWTHAARDGVIRAAHYRGVQPGFQASPLIAGDVVWAADTSGHLDALDLSTGEVVWSTELGAPALGGMASAGDFLIVPTYDGAVHALVPSRDGGAVGDPDASAEGCCAAGGGGASGASWLALGTLAALRRRRRTCA